MPDTNDVYRDLSPELVALLRDPRVVLPGEMQTLETINRHHEALDSPTANAHSASIYLDEHGNRLTVRRDT